MTPPTPESLAEFKARQFADMLRYKEWEARERTHLDAFLAQCFAHMRKGAP